MAVRNFPVRDTRHYNFFAPVVRIAREPLSTDIKDPSTGRYYERPTFWQIGRNPSTGTEGDLWYLADITANVADWQKLATSSGEGGTIISLTGDDAAIVFADVDGNIDVQGSTVANATNAKPLYIDGTPASNLIEVELQVAAAVTGAPADNNDAGVCSFDDTAFSVDANGYVTLVGGAGPTVDSVGVDFNTAPGTDPIVPDGTGLITVGGSTVANATNSNAPIATHSRAANAFNIEAQVAAAITGAPGDKFDAGLASFNDTQFTVDADGYVALVGGTDLAPVQTLTGDSGGAISPDASGNIDIVGDTGVTVTGSGNQLSVALDNQPFNPLTMMRHWDDFLFSETSSGSDNTSNMYWNTSAIRANVSADIESGHPGIWALDGLSNRDIGLSGSGLSTGGIVPGGGEITIHWVFKTNALSDATNGYRLRIGFSDATQSFPPTDGIWFEYTHGTNSGNWQIVSRAASTSTTNNTSTAAVADWTRATIVINAAGTSVAYYIDGVEVSNSPITTNIPSSISPYASIQNLAGSGTILKLDLMYVEQQLTTAR